MNLGERWISIGVGYKIANEDVFTVRPQNVFDVKRNYIVLNETAKIINSVCRFVLFGPLHFLIAIIMFYQFVFAFCQLLLSSAQHVKCPTSKNLELFQHLYSDNFRNLFSLCFIHLIFELKISSKDSTRFWKAFWYHSKFDGNTEIQAHISWQKPSVHLTTSLHIVLLMKNLHVKVLISHYLKPYSIKVKHRKLIPLLRMDNGIYTHPERQL